MPQNATAPGAKFGGFGFGRQGEKAAADRGWKISRPADSLPRKQSLFIFVYLYLDHKLTKVMKDTQSEFLVKMHRRCKPDRRGNSLVAEILETCMITRDV